MSTEHSVRTKRQSLPLLLDNLRSSSTMETNEQNLESMQNSARQYEKMKKMQSIILGMQEGVRNMFPKLKQKKLPTKSKTSINVLDLIKKPVPIKRESYLSKIQEEIAEREIIIDSLSDDRS